MITFVKWQNLKKFVSDKNLELFYQEEEFYYCIYTLFNQVKFYTEIWKDASKCAGLDVELNNINKTDFETNYKENIREL